MATKQLVIVLLTLLLALRPGAQKVLTEPESEANPMPVGMERDRSHQIQALEEQLARLRLEEQILASELSVPGTNRANPNAPPGSSFEVVSVTRSPLAETEKGDDARKTNEAIAAHDTAPRGTQPVSVAQADTELEAGRPTTPNAQEQTSNAGASFFEFLEEEREEEKGEDISMSEVHYVLLQRLLRRWRKSYAAAMAWQLFSYLNGLAVRSWRQTEKAFERIADQCTEARETQTNSSCIKGVDIDVPRPTRVHFNKLTHVHSGQAFIFEIFNNYPLNAIECGLIIILHFQPNDVTRSKI